VLSTNAIMRLFGGAAVVAAVACATCLPETRPPAKPDVPPDSHPTDGMFGYLDSAGSARAGQGGRQYQRLSGAGFTDLPV